jgi:proline iminopeptidase
MKKCFFTFLTSISCIFVFAQDSTFFFQTSDSVRLFVRIAGKGKPCVFVHGGPGSTAYYFEAMAAAPLIEKKMRMIYFDQRGSGRSASAANGDYSLKRMEKDIEELRQALGYKKWALMAHSFGGIIAGNYALHHPASTSALLLINCTLNMQASIQSHLDNGLKLLGITDQASFRDTARPVMERVSMVHNLLTEKGIWYHLMFRNAYEKKYSDSITFVVNPFNFEFGNKVWGVPEYWKDFTPVTAAIKCPVLVMTGEKDFAVGPDLYKTYRFPKTTVAKYIGGHAPFQEEPQWFAEKVIAFAEKNGF